MKSVFNRITRMCISLIAIVFLGIQMNIHGMALVNKFTSTQKDKNKALAYAIFCEHYEDVEAALKNGANPNGWTRQYGQEVNGQSMLSLALERNNEKICKLLLDCKANPNTCVIESDLLLESADTAPSFFKFLLNKSKDVYGMALMNKFTSTQKDKNRAPLAYAIFCEHYEDVEAALKNGANPNGWTHQYGQEVNGQSMLSLALERKNEKICKLLLAFKANPDTCVIGSDLLLRSTDTTPSFFKFLLNQSKNVHCCDSLMKNLLSSDRCHFSHDDRFVSLSLVMERPECDDHAVEFAYTNIGRSTINLDDVRARNYYQRVDNLIPKKILEINSAGKSQTIFPPLARIIARYAAEYYCMDTRPLAITFNE